PSEYFKNLVDKWTERDMSVMCIYNGIDFSVKYAKAGKYDEFTIITAGRLVPWKGVDVIIELLVDLPECRLIVAGDGPERMKLESLTRKLGVGDRVVFMGNISREELFAEMCKSHIFVLNTSFESFSF